MEERRTSVFENGLIWFGAAVSIAEIMTGTYFAPLGFGKGLLAICIGHIIGCVLLFFAGRIGGRLPVFWGVSSSISGAGAVGFIGRSPFRSGTKSPSGPAAPECGSGSLRPGR